jgi:hypothetical protein
VTAPKRHGRAITVDGHRLCWRYRRDRDHEPHVVIADASREGQVVVFAVGWFSVITPLLVATAARDALARGWIPGHGRGELRVVVAGQP